MRTLCLTLLTLAALPLAAQETRFTKTMAQGSHLAVENINGPIVVTQGSGRTAEIVVTKIVHRGDGSLVKAIMEERGGVVRVCTVYLNRGEDRTTCDGEHSTSHQDGNNQVEMKYEVRLPAGIVFDATSVNGAITATGLDADVALQTVNGAIVFEGATARHLTTVNGGVHATLTRPAWQGTLDISAVNGGVELTLPASFDAEVSGESVSGGIHSDFPITMQGKWGPKSFHGTIGKGGRTLKIETVNGGITLKKG
jgi:hypothetical protein